MSFGQKPFGLRQIKLENIAGDVVVSLPSAMTMQFSERVTTGEMRGNDRTQAAVSIADALEWSLESGGISLEAWALMTGRQAVESGSTPNKQKTLTAKAGDRFPYFKIYGKMVGDEGNDDVWVVIYKAKLTEAPNGSFQDASFFNTACGGIALGDVENDDQIWDIIQHETTQELPADT